MKNIKKYFKILENKFLAFDIYGHPIELYIDSNITCRSKFGAIISLTVFLLCIIIFSNNYQEWSNKTNLQTISSYKSFTIKELIDQNENYIYDLNYSNYNLYFTLYSIMENSTTVFNDHLKQFFEIKVIYANEYDEEIIEIENCSKNKMGAFLDSNQAIEVGKPDTIMDKINCLAKNISMGIFVKKDHISTPILEISINMCKNSSVNNFSCASIEEIFSLIKSTRFQMSFPQTLYDFKKLGNPKQRIYENRVFNIYSSMAKYYNAQIIPSYIFTDNGVFEDDYQLESLDFNTGNLRSESVLIEENGVLLNFKLSFELNQQIYYRKNIKIFDFFGKLGGIINILFLLGKIICSFYNRLVLNHKLVNISFSNLSSSLIESKSNNYKFKFSFLPLLFPNLYPNRPYSIALKNIYEYMDIKNIIKRLQDIDKLKLILLNENQRKLFEILPKPAIGGSQPIRPSTWTIEKVLESKNPILGENLPVFANDDPLGIKMYGLLDSKKKQEFKEIYEKSKEAKQYSADSERDQKVFIKKEEDNETVPEERIEKFDENFQKYIIN